MKIVSAKDKYANTVVAEMRKEFGYDNVMAIPKIQKVVVNVGIGKIIKENEKIEEVYNALTMITGQKPVKTKAKKAIAGFKVREGQEVGIKVTLRGNRMWQLIDRLIGVTLPRTRDFQGITRRSVDSTGNLNVGIKEHMIFPEISPEKVRHIFGMQITITTTATSQKEGLVLFKALGFPLKSE